MSIVRHQDLDSGMEPDNLPVQASLAALVLGVRLQPLLLRHQDQQRLLESVVAVTV